jgi:hypothetical protein
MTCRVLRLKPGWRFARRRRTLVSPAGQARSLRRLLSRGTRIVPLAPSLAAADPQTLSEDEDDPLTQRCGKWA